LTMENKDWTKNLVLILMGIYWILIGVETLNEPVYYFRGAYVDFTGINLYVGVSLIVVGLIFCGTYFYKKNKNEFINSTITTRKLFFVNFLFDVVLRYTFSVLLMLFNGVFIYDIVNGNGIVNGILIFYIWMGMNIGFMVGWYFINMLVVKLSPYIQIENNHIKIYYWNFFDHWKNTHNFDIDEIDRIEIIDERSPNDTIFFTQKIFVVLKDGNHIQVHKNYSGPTKKQMAFRLKLEKMTGKPVVTEIRKIPNSSFYSSLNVHE